MVDTLEHLVHKDLIGADLRPIPPEGTINIVKNGVIFQGTCRNGLPYDIVVSWLQKAIRRGLCQQAWYCAYHIAELGKKIFRSHLLNRLIIILSEDIGPAEPGLAVKIEELYTEAKSLEPVPDKDGTFHDEDELIGRMKRVILEMVYLLCKAKKSRITDWLIHVNEDVSSEREDSYGDINETFRWAIQTCRGRIKSDEWIPVTYTCKGEDYSLRKRLEIYHLWNVLLDMSSDTKSYDEVVSLLKLFMHRGCEYGILHLAHAITLCFLEKDMPKRRSIPMSALALPRWNTVGQYDFPILNDAVDKHTFYGRTYLGRTSLDFMRFGSKLENWYPFPGEKEIIQQITDKIDPPEVEDSIPREYQAQIVQQVTEHLTEQITGWLLMACGTGKTKTSYWCVKDLCDQEKVGQKRLIVVVTPFLVILRQFYNSWAAMNRMHKIKVMSGILASCTDSFERDPYTNYEYITWKTIAQFIDLPYDTRIIFTTYSSILTLIEAGVTPDITIYDEAHHLKMHKRFGCGYEIFLTATPHEYLHSYGDVMAKYNLRNAINDGYLTPYIIGVMQYDDKIECLRYIMSQHKKTIVYCKTNDEARWLRDLWELEETEIPSFFVYCKTPKRARIEIFDKYKRATTAVIFNCAILGEGVDFTDCDSIFIASGYMSPRKVVQAACRPLRLSEGKDIAGIYIYDDGDKKVNKRINGMALYDPEVYDMVSYIYEGEEDEEDAVDID